MDGRLERSELDLGVLLDGRWGSADELNDKWERI